MSLKGKVAVVTGAASGIGEGLAHAAAEDGLRVVVADIDKNGAERVAADISAKGAETLVYQIDVTDAAAHDRMFVATMDRFGSVSMVFANAGIEMLGNCWELSIEQWNKMIGINIAGMIHTVRAFSGHMVATGEPGHISITSSIGGVGMMPVQTPYIVSKHATLSFAECLSLEMQRSAPAIRVSAVVPGPVATRIFTDAPGGSNPANVDHHRETMHEMLQEQGLSGLEAGRVIFDQVKEGKFWVTTHPEMLRQALQDRADHLAGMTYPTLKEHARHVLGDVPARPV